MTSHPLKGLIERTGLQSVSRAAQNLQELGDNKRNHAMIVDDADPSQDQGRGT